MFLEKCFGVETALLNIHYDILQLDTDNCVFFVLLDLNAVLDTVAYTRLLHAVGGTGICILRLVLQWMESYSIG